MFFLIPTVSLTSIRKRLPPRSRGLFAASLPSWPRRWLAVETMSLSSLGPAKVAQVMRWAFGKRNSCKSSAPGP